MDYEMDSAEYVGPLPQLRGRKALVKPDETYDEPDIEKRTLLAQFDDKSEGFDTNPRQLLIHPDTNEPLCFGWHTFPVKHFKILGM